ncbi:Calx-beta domain-containing protein, partial [Flagellimonas hymeniacidonis]|uniref:Calx-beta domain-containing protein n=1 Tax=Flagellimonas hymeniacidonis TaxID=2603628 RepID=UPI00293926C7
MNTTDGSENGAGVVTNGVLTITQTSTTITNTDVSYSIAGTATSGADYTALSGTATITANQLSTTITIPVLEDAIDEDNETVIITLTGVTSGTATLDPVPANLTATNTILDDDTYTATISATDATATELGTTTGEYTVSLDVANSSGGVITVDYTVTGTATSGSDFVALTGSVDIPDTQQTATILLTPIDDTDVEPDETVTVTLDAGTGYTVGAPNSADVTITSDDVAPADPVATISATDATATELGTTTGEYTVSLDVANSSGGVITVDYTVT